MRNHRNFWDRNAGRYDRFMRKDRAAYEEMYALIRPVVKAKTVLELATGTGLIAKHIVNAAAHIEATDASAEMILEAKRDNQSAKLHFSVHIHVSECDAQKSAADPATPISVMYLQTTLNPLMESATVSTVHRCASFLTRK